MIDRPCKGALGPRQRPVIKMDPQTGKVVETYDTLMQAFQALPFEWRNDSSYGYNLIRKCCSGRVASAFGYKWEDAK
jgi:hypothetical protein